MDDKAAITIHFPVKPHVYKYLQKKVGEKLVVVSTSYFGATVLDILSKNHSDYSVVKSDLTYSVEISLRYMEKNGVYLNPRVVRKFNARIDDIFREELRTHIEISYTINNIPKERSLRDFLLVYDITEDDIKFETLVKDFHRNIK